MVKKTDEIKKNLIQATIGLLKESQDPSSLTVRQIGEKAQVNIAMINYYFKSKDELVQQAIGILLENTVGQWLTVEEKGLDPVEKLKMMLKQMNDMVVKYANFTKVTVAYELFNGKLEVPHYIIPLLREIFQGSKDEKEIKVIAFTLITSAQVIFYRAEEFGKYAGLDIFRQQDRDDLVEILVDNLTKGGKP